MKDDQRGLQMFGGPVWLIFMILISPVLLGFWFLPRKIGSFRRLVAICLGAWVAAALAVAFIVLRASDESEYIYESVQQLNDMQTFFNLLAVTIPLYAFTLGAIPRGIELFQGRKTNLFELAWQISLVVMFVLLALPLLI